MGENNPMTPTPNPAIRDPRIDPRKGDLIQQRPSKIKIRVTFTDGEKIGFAQVKRGYLVKPNEWTLRGWQEMVAKGSVILERGDD